MKAWVGWVALWVAAAAWPTQASAADAAAFDAAKAWVEFTDLLENDYAYFQRPGIDGPGILALFAARAQAARNAGEFIAVAKLVARNFADPHFNVGPAAPEDPSVIPTGSDLHAECAGTHCVIRDVRAGSDAAAQGVPVGAEVVAIDGRAPAAAIEALLGRPAQALADAQRSYGLNLALAGVRNRPRQLVVRAGDIVRDVALTSTYEHADAIRAGPALQAERRGALGIIRFNNSLGRHETIAEFGSALQGLLDTRALVIDLRNTPSGGNTTVARAIMGHFVTRERPYQVHVVPGEQRRWGVPRKFIELVLPRSPAYRGQVFVLGGRWTGSMGEGLMIGFDALGHRTAGSRLGHLLGAMFNETLPTSGARIELGEEQLLHVNGSAREAFRPALFVEPAEAQARGDPALQAVMRTLKSGPADRRRRAAR